MIEIGMVPFTYGDQGQVYSVDEPFSMLREPSFPISGEVTKINNITNDMVSGKSIDPNEVFKFAQQAGLIIAHNASFDRIFLEKYAPRFSEKAWACFMSQIAWKEEGFDGNRLSHIAAGFGFFYDAHRAVEDCWAGIEVLSRALPVSGELGLSKLLSAARKDTQRVWAVSAPFDLKDVLKARGYRWNDGNDGRPKAWYIDVVFEAYDEECRFLETEIYQRKINLLVTKITAKERFSTRV
ncbi:MAG: 3'-5' exonuclease [Litorimonas sp.]